MRKIIILGWSLFLISCSSNSYDKMVKKDFKKSEYKRILEKKEGEKTYYKYDFSKKFSKETLFFLIEKSEESKIYLGVNYEGKDWLYMKSIVFEGVENFEIDFLNHKTFNPIWKDKTNIKMGVEEKILFSLTQEQIEKLEEILKENKVYITLKSEYTEKTDNRQLSQKEVMRMNEILALYKTIQQENERKEDGN